MQCYIVNLLYFAMAFHCVHLCELSFNVLDRTQNNILTKLNDSIQGVGGFWFRGGLGVIVSITFARLFFLTHSGYS